MYFRWVTIMTFCIVLLLFIFILFMFVMHFHKVEMGYQQKREVDNKKIVCCFNAKKTLRLTCLFCWYNCSRAVSFNVCLIISAIKLCSDRYRAVNHVDERRDRERDSLFSEYRSSGVQDSCHNYAPANMLAQHVSPMLG